VSYFGTVVDRDVKDIPAQCSEGIALVKHVIHGIGDAPEYERPPNAGDVLFEKSRRTQLNGNEQITGYHDEERNAYSIQTGQNTYVESRVYTGDAVIWPDVEKLTGMLEHNQEAGHHTDEVKRKDTLFSMRSVWGNSPHF